jgi:hypothetical protein
MKPLGQGYATPHPLNGQYTVHGHKLDVQVSPCSWMYNGYGLQVAYTSDKDPKFPKFMNGVDEKARSWGYVHDKTYQENTASRADVQKMLEKHLAPEACQTCNNPHLYNASGNRGHQCNVCFIAKLGEETKRAMEKEKKQEQRRDARHKRQGFTHKVTAWIHPERGDDRQVVFYFKGEPTTDGIKSLLRAEGSRITDDFSVKAL